MAADSDGGKRWGGRPRLSGPGDHPMKLAAFPKGILEDIAVHRTMSLFDWIGMARELDCEGLELYDGFLLSLDPAYLDRVRLALDEAGFAMPMLCCSPDFTNPDADAREREIEREAELIRVARHLGGPGTRCRVLSGQRYPEVETEQGLEWVAGAIERLIPVAREHDVVLALENHYKDGHWRYPEFAQRGEVFLRLLEMIPEREHFGVQYDPSNAIVAGDDPIWLLHEVADRVVSVHASDRFLAPGASLDDLRQSDGTIGYSPVFQHGVVGKGLNDYDAIFTILREAGYDGWVSIEDGVNGMGEMAQSLAFLRGMRARYYGE
jgi:sugar phosphate isomerase/epimerase